MSHDVAATYTNPVYDGYFADPFVLRHRGAYWAYGTGSRLGSHVFEVLVSPDLGSWTSAGGALEVPDGVTGETYWAPEVVAAEGTWWMFYSVGVQDRDHQIRVARATAPAGPFVDAGVVLTPDEPFAIDPHPFCDRDGQWYLYYARDVLEGERVGTALAVDRLTSMTALARSPRSVLTATADWQLFRAARPMYGGVYDWHTLEGPFVCEHDGRYYCFYSGGAWHQPNYGVAYGVGDHPMGPFREPPLGGPTVLRSIPDAVIGPGHNSVVRAPDGSDYIIYHAWDVGRTRRRMCIDRLEWGPDGPRCDGPTSSPQPLPLARP